MIDCINNLQNRTGWGKIYEKVWYRRLNIISNGYGE
jgi:hypothetical protein